MKSKPHSTAIAEARSATNTRPGAKNGRWMWQATAIAVLTCVAYFPALQGGFVWDDDNLVTNNLLVKDARGLVRIWVSFEALDYWPVTNSAFWTQWRLWG